MPCWWSIRSLTARFNGVFFSLLDMVAQCGLRSCHGKGEVSAMINADVKSERLKIINTWMIPARIRCLQILQKNGNQDKTVETGGGHSDHSYPKWWLGTFCKIAQNLPGSWPLTTGFAGAWISGFTTLSSPVSPAIVWRSIETNRWDQPTNCSCWKLGGRGIPGVVFCFLELDEDHNNYSKDQ